MEREHSLASKGKEAYQEAAVSMMNAPVIESRLRRNIIRVPREIEQATGIVVLGRRIKSLLYSTDIGQFHNIIDDAPHTNAFGQASAPRTTAYIGLQIVNRYMKKSGATMQQLFDNTDSRAILTASGWRP